MILILVLLSYAFSCSFSPSCTNSSPTSGSINQRARKGVEGCSLAILVALLGWPVTLGSGLGAFPLENFHHPVRSARGFWPGPGRKRRKNFSEGREMGQSLRTPKFPENPNVRKHF